MHTPKDLHTKQFEACLLKKPLYFPSKKYWQIRIEQSLALCLEVISVLRSNQRKCKVPNS